MKKGLLVIISMLIIACGGGSSGNGSSDDVNINISGEFDSTGKFTASSDLSATLASSTATNQYLLKGKLEDGSIIFNLTGTYNSDTGSYILSAASSMIAYQIKGSIDATGVAQDAEVTVSTKSGNSWTSVTHIATNIGTEVTIDGAADPQVDGLPEKWTGTWNISGEQAFLIISPFVIDAFFHREGKWRQDDGDNVPVVAVTKISDVEYDLLAYGIVPDGSKAYRKYNITENSDTQLTMNFYGAAGQTAFNSIDAIPTTFDGSATTIIR